MTPLPSGPCRRSWGVTFPSGTEPGQWWTGQHRGGSSHGGSAAAPRCLHDAGPAARTPDAAGKCHHVGRDHVGRGWVVSMVSPACDSCLGVHPALESSVAEVLASTQVSPACPHPCPHPSCCLTQRCHRSPASHQHRCTSSGAFTGGFADMQCRDRQGGRWVMLGHHGTPRAGTPLGVQLGDPAKLLWGSALVHPQGG